MRFRFAYTTDEEIIEKMKYSGSAVVVYRAVRNIISRNCSLLFSKHAIQAKFISDKHGEKLKARYPGKVLKKESLPKFIEEKIFTLVGLKTKSNERRYL